jgi:positive regulator of sigma E activity
MIEALLLPSAGVVVEQGAAVAKRQQQEWCSSCCSRSYAGLLPRRMLLKHRPSVKLVSAMGLGYFCGAVRFCKLFVIGRR